MHHGTCEWQQTDPQWFEPVKELGSPCSPWRLRLPPGLATNQLYWYQTPHLERDKVKLHTNTHLQESKHTRHNTLKSPPTPRINLPTKYGAVQRRWRLPYILIRVKISSPLSPPPPLNLPTSVLRLPEPLEAVSLYAPPSSPSSP